MSMTSSNNRFRVSSPTGILSYIPHALGFLPHESVVLLTLGSNILGATLRLDLPEQEQLSFARTAYEFLRQDRAADAVIAVLYTEAEWLEPSQPPYQELMRCLELVLAAGGLPVRAAWLVSTSSWREYYCADLSCCPWPGHPLEGITDSELNAELIFRGSTYDPSLATAMARTVERSCGDTTALLASSARWRECVQDRWLQEDQFLAALEVWDAVFEGATDQDWLEANPDTAGYLLASLEVRNLRDAVLVLAARGRETAWEGALACALLQPSDAAGQRPESLPGAALAVPENAPTGRLADTAPDPERSYGDLLVGHTPVAPSWPRLDAAYELFRLLAAGSTGEAGCALLVMLGWVDWARGRGSRAGSFCDQCLVADPTYRLALLLNELLNRGELPDWAMNRSSAWSGNRNRAA